MNNELTIKSTSLTSVEAPQIVLRENENMRLIFEPLIVDNKNNNKASVKGTFRMQRKGKKDSWENYKEVDANKLKAGEWTQLELKSDELYKLITGLDKLYQIHEKYGLVMGETKVMITDENVSQIIDEILKNTDAINKIIDQGGINIIGKIITEISRLKDVPKVLEIMKNINLEDRNRISFLLGLMNIKNLLEIWENNKDNSQEEFWQERLMQNSWALSNIFSQPSIIIAGKPFMGGKGINNIGGSYQDFLYKNSITNNVCIIEIKTPVTKILGQLYRNEAYSMSSEITGALNQLSTNKNKFLHEFVNLKYNTKMDFGEFNAYNPKGYLILGNASLELDDNNKLKSFELFRNGLSNVEIITFDELFEKIKQIVNILENPAQL
mgnify:CR=1 FL=1